MVLVFDLCYSYDEEINIFMGKIIKISDVIYFVLCKFYIVFMYYGDVIWDF